jgi:uncharacterized heparinase superfamily protein
MARLAFGDHVKALWLLLRGALRQFARRLNGHPLLRWPFLPLRTDRLLIAPPDLRTTDATRASEIYSGRFAFAGKVVVCDGRSIFDMEPPSDEWAAELLGFGWLRHLRSADSTITRANARALVDEWIARQGSWHKLGWRPGILSRRVMSWLSQSTLVLQDTDAAFYRRFLRSLTRQINYLRRTAADGGPGVADLQGVIALTNAALCMAGQARRISPATERLRRELQRQILPDGGHVGRNPAAIIQILLELLPLRQVYASRNIAPPPALLNAIDRVMPMLRFFRHSDGSFARFNGMGPTPADLLLTLLAYDESHGAPLSNAPHSGYQRLEARGAVLIMDVGGAPPIEMSFEAHAGCLAFEFSTPEKNMLIVNCGMPSMAREEWRPLARSTAAHSTVTFNNASSARFFAWPAFRHVLGGAPMTGGPSHVAVSRDDHTDAFVLRATHDAYAQSFGILHERTLILAAHGSHLAGEDAFLPANASSRLHGTRDQYAIRFHLHPSVRVTPLAHGQGAMLMSSGREVWIFTVKDRQLEIEDSVYLAGSEGPRRTAQLVIYGNARSAPVVSWSLRQSAPASMARESESDIREEEPRLPL